MQAIVDSLIHIDKNTASSDRLFAVRRKLSIAQVEGKNAILHKIYQETDERLSVPRSFFLDSESSFSSISYDLHDGDEWSSPSKDVLYQDEDIDVSESSYSKVIQTFGSKFRDKRAVDCILLFPSENSACKTSLLLSSIFRKKSLFLFDCDFSAHSFYRLVRKAAPHVRCSYFKELDFKNADIVISSIDDLLLKVDSIPSVSHLFGAIFSINIDRIYPPSWEQVVLKFKCSTRIATAHPSYCFDRGVSKIYKYHLGNPIFCAEPEYEIPKIRRVWSGWKISSWVKVNPQFISKDGIIDQLCSSSSYNSHIVEQLILALQAGRKIVLFSEKISHLKNLKSQFESAWSGPEKRADFAIEGMAYEDLKFAMASDVILTTFSFAKGLPEDRFVDTVLLASPVKDPSDAVRIALYKNKTKKSIVIVDMRCDEIPVCKDYARARDQFYKISFNEDLSQ